MPAFEFRALDAGGRTEQGVLQADTARGARAALRARGLLPMAVATVGGQRRLRLGGRVLLLRQLAVLVQAGLPLDDALSAMADGADAATRATALAVRARVMEGATLADALAEFPDSFDALACASIAAGEQSGQLARVLLGLAAHGERREALRQRFIAALAYPALVLAIALAVVAGLLVYVVPEVSAVFVRGGQVLPLPTRLLLAVSAFTATQAWWLLPVLVLGGIAAIAAWRRRAWRDARDAWLLRLPGLGPWLGRIEAARHARTLAMGVASGVPLLDALALANDTVQNRQARAEFRAAAMQVGEGRSLSQALAASGRYPPVALRLVASGERAGRLDAMLDEAAAEGERRLDHTTGLLMSALGPAVILGVGALVLFIVLAILLPVFEMNQLLR